MIYRDLRALADALDDGTLEPAQAAKDIRELARFQPADNCTRMVSSSRYLARVDDTWEWSVLVDRDVHGSRPRLISNRYTRHQSNLDTVIDFDRWEPADVDVFGRAICEAAAVLAAHRAYDDEED